MKTKFMDREFVLQRLRSHISDLHRLGVRSIALFGSVARGEAEQDSDVDLLVELEPPYTFDRYIQAKFFLEDLLGCPVDLVMQETLKPRARITAEKEAICVA